MEQPTTSRWYDRPAVLALGIFALCAAIFAFIQFSIPGLADNDSYYHAKMGWLIHSQGLKPDFTWLPQTILNPDAYYDHHMLYHVYLALFAWRDPASDGGAALVLGAKIAVSIMGGLTWTAIWWLLRGLRIRWAAAWTLGLFAVSSIFLFRLNMVRAQAPSLLVLALALHWLFQGRYRRLAPLGFVYVWLYNAFPLLVAVAGVYVAAVFVMERRMVWAALIYPLAGIVLGLVINPYVPANIVFIVSHILPKLSAPTADIGQEWFPYDSWTLMQVAGFAYALGILGLISLILRKRGFDKTTLVTFLLFGLFGVLALNSKRFLEYFPAFALIFGATSITPLLEDWRARPAATQRVARYAGLLAPTAGLLALLITVNQARTLMLALDILHPAAEHRAAATWLRANVPQGALIYTADWREFPRLFFYDTDHAYLLGLDPTYLQLADGAKYDLYTAINRGEVKNLGQIVPERFGASYIIANLNQTELVHQAGQDPTLREIYRSEDAVVWKAGP